METATKGLIVTIGIIYWFYRDYRVQGVAVYGVDLSKPAAKKGFGV